MLSEVAIVLEERAISVNSEVRGACEILGLDPLTIANEGNLLAVVAKDHAEDALSVTRAHPLGREATIVGTVQAEPAAMVFLHTEIGRKRVLDLLSLLLPDLG
jgi:hydrogenase expression/formation protein HypE